MPGRTIPLITKQVYHVVNRGVASQPIFLAKSDYERAKETMFFYQNRKLPLRYSFFLRSPSKERENIISELAKKKNFLVEIICYCFMPNHIHLLLKQTHDGGISSFMSNFSNSYTRYFNTNKKRVGPIFQGKFNAIRVETDEQLLHTSRYIHLNPYTSYIVKNLKDLIYYPHSSFPEYLNPENSNFCSKELILSRYKNPDFYKKFVFDQADYQRKLNEIKHLILEKT